MNGLMIAAGLFLCSAPMALAGGSVRGTVAAQNGVGIAGAKVSAVGLALSTVTDGEGRFRLDQVPTGQPVLIIASASGFESHEKWASVVDGHGVELDFELSLARVREDVKVMGEIPLLTTGGDLGVVRLAPDQIASLPSLGERDIFRTMQLLPGISGSNETSSGLYVRGSTPDQTLVSYDGFTVYHVDHLFGYFTAFNMEAVEDVELRKGAYEARYGGRLSSVMELRGRSGPKDRWSGSATASMLSVSGSVSMPIAQRGSLLLAGRRSFQSPLYNDILDLFGTNGNGVAGGGLVGGGRGPTRMGGGPGGAGAFGYEQTPSSHFYDVNGKVWFQLGPKDRVALSTYGGRDNLDNSSSFEIPEFTPGQSGGGRFGGSGSTESTPTFTISGSIDTSDISRWTNRGASFTWSRQWNDRQRTQFVAATSRYDRLRDTSTAGEITVTGDTTGFPTPSAAGASNAQYESNELDDVTLGVDHSAQLGQSHRLHVGAQYTQNDVSYQFDTEIPGAVSERPGRLLGASNLSQLLDRSEKGALLSAYVQDQVHFGRLTLTPGLRVASFDRTSETYVEPRLSFGLQLGADVRLKGGYGSYTQVVNRIEREDFSRGSQEFWTLSDGTAVPAAHSRHLVAGASYEHRSLLVDLELFAKTMDDLTTFAPRLRPGEDVGQSGSDFYQGTGKARGVELLVQKKAGRHTGWLSYTLSRTELDFPSLEAEPYPASHDQTHELKLVDSARLGKWTLSGTWIIATGKPYTAATGISSIEIGDLTGDDSADNRRQIGFPEFGAKNAARLPAYHRLDLALRYDWRLKGARGDLGVTVFNVYDRHNVWYKEFQAFDSSLIESDVTLMGRAVNLFVGLRF